jgi:hypothetical protein
MKPASTEARGRGRFGALSLHIGYDRAPIIAHRADDEDARLRDGALALGRREVLESRECASANRSAPARRYLARSSRPGQLHECDSGGITSRRAATDRVDWDRALQ